MKSKYILLTFSSLLLASCGGNSPVASSVLESKQSESSLLSSGLDESSDYIAAFESSNASFYRISSTYTIKSGASVVASGESAKQVYVGVDVEGFDTKIEWLRGSKTTPAGLEDNDVFVTTRYSIYHSVSETYTLQENGAYKVTAEEHPNIAPYACPFLFSKGEGIKNTLNRFEMNVSGRVSDANVSSFLGNAISSKEGIKDLSFTITFSAKEAYLKSLSLFFNKDGFAVSQTYRFSSTNSPLSLPKA